MNYSELQSELGHKQRTVGDLARYLGNIPDKTPNYCVFLGAGASVTSGIKSGGCLVDEWRHDVFETLNSEDKYSAEFAKKFFAEKHSNWYDMRNEYSSLFEKKFDLPRQRRMFVESEVADKIPSIGYAYLMRLIEKGYVNTIFTTNFDDLCNEAFYRYSDVRPICCAHDSAISSITVTSKRPKIIKLHGDFLFDDIKSTLRETESLEVNMKNKFIEFAKDYGLVVVGYGGFDRSILDVLNYLLRHDDYFKNGIYWCLRSDDEIGSELHKLLWKDRVYYVNIDGFDEFFAQLNNIIQKEVLPLDTNLLNNKPARYLENFQKQISRSIYSSEIINEDVGKMSDKLQVENFRNFIADSEPENDNSESFRGSLKIEHQVAAYKLNNMLETGSFEDFLKEIRCVEDTTESNSLFRKEIFELKAKYFHSINKNDDVVAIYETLYEEYGKDPKYLCRIARIQEEKGIDAIDRAIARDKNYYLPYLLKADMLLREYSNSLVKKASVLEKIKNNLLVSVEKRPSLTNRAWIAYFRVLRKYSSLKDFDDECTKWLNKARCQDDCDEYTLEMELDYLKVTGGDSWKEQAAQLMNEKVRNSYAFKKYILREFQLGWLVDNKFDDNIQQKLNKYRDKYKVTSDFVLIEAQYYGSYLGKFDKAIDVLESYINKNFSRSVYAKVIEYKLFNKNFKEADALYEKYFQGDSFMKYKIDFENGNWEKIEKDLYDVRKENIDNVENYSYSLMKQKKYADAKMFLREILDETFFAEQLLIINYEICCYFVDGRFDKSRVQKIHDNYKSRELKMGAAMLLGKKDEAEEMIKENILNDHVTKLKYSGWPIFDLDICQEYRKLLA